MTPDLISTPPQVLQIGDAREFIEVVVPSTDGSIRREVVGIAEHCIYSIGQERRSGSMVWLGNVNHSVDASAEKQVPIIQTLPTWVTVYTGRALNTQDIHYLPPFNHGGVWIERDAVQIDNE